MNRQNCWSRDGFVEPTRAEDGRPAVRRVAQDQLQDGSVQPAGRQRVPGTGQHESARGRVRAARGTYPPQPSAFGRTTTGAHSRVSLAFIRTLWTSVETLYASTLQIRVNRSKAPNDCAVINCQYSMATFSRSERKRRPRDNKSAELTVHLKQAMTTAIKTDLYPKSQIDIFVEV